jgi:hypothetical protein
MVSWEADFINSLSQEPTPPPRWPAWVAWARDFLIGLVCFPFWLLRLWLPTILCLILFTLAYLGLCDVGDFVRHALHNDGP